MEKEQLIRTAIAAREKAYCPYSHYAVGAAVLTDTGEIVPGCNVENASYGLTNCAERTAIFAAVSRGARRLQAIAIAGAGSPPYPCGACRQVMTEFASDPEMPVIVVMLSNGEEKVEEYTLAELLPHGFML